MQGFGSSGDCEGNGFAPFDRRTRLFEMTRRVLLARLAAAELDPLIANLVSSEVLPHVERIERGQHAGLRSAELDPGLVQELVRRAGIGVSPTAGSFEAVVAATARERGRAAGRLVLRTFEGRLLEDAAHAAVVLAFIPRVPDTAVSWPMCARRTYLDIPAPFDDGERIARVEELERVLWGLATGAAPAPNESWRRTFAFFEAGVWLDHALLGPSPFDA